MLKDKKDKIKYQRKRESKVWVRIKCLLKKKTTQLFLGQSEKEPDSTTLEWKKYLLI